MESAPKDGTRILLGAWVHEEHHPEDSRWLFWQGYWRQYLHGYGEGFGGGPGIEPSVWTHLPLPRH